MLAVGLALLLCATAHAGTYEVWSCAGPDAKPAPVEGWSGYVTGPEYESVSADTCASGTGLYAGLDGRYVSEPGARREWIYTAPANQTIAGFRIWRGVNAVGQPPSNFTVYSIYTAREGNDYPDIEVCDSRKGCTTLGTGTAFGDGTLISASNLTATKEIHLELLCAGEAPGCPATSGQPQLAFRMYRAAVALQDDSVPTFLSPPAGSLTAGGPLSGTQSVSFSAADTGSGVQSAELEVDGRTVATQDFGCPPPYVHLTPCKLANGGTLSLDTAALADGQHSVRVLVRDATQTNVGVAGPFTITTANTPTSCAPEAATNFAVRLDRRGSTIAYGAKLNVSGTLGGVVAGTPVLLQSQVDRPGAPAKLGRTPLLVAAAGRFTYRVPP